MEHPFSRTELMLGPWVLERLSKAHVAVFGIGGVGGYAVEALVRSGIGAIDLIDNDRVCVSNLNRQIIATRDTIGRYKVDVMEERIRSICPETRVAAHHVFFLPETADRFDFSAYDYVIDAVDTVTAKLELVIRSERAQVPIISCMGTGNKLDPSRLLIGDIYETSVCPLARVMRRELRKRGVERLTVLYSTEEPLRPAGCGENPEGTGDGMGKRRAVPGSVSFVPSAAGLLIAARVVTELANMTGKEAEGEER